MSKEQKLVNRLIDFTRIRLDYYCILLIYQVNDYVKNYIGEGKGPKNFAKEYLERRSKYKNSLKQNQKIEDDLLTPAQAINPNREPDDGFIGGNGVAGKKAQCQ